MYLGDSGAQRAQPGLSLVPKLKYEHIHLTSFSRMRVDLAAQVLSNSGACCVISGQLLVHVAWRVCYDLHFFLQVLSNTVATALRLTGKDEVEETARFVTMFDRLFDCLNVADFDSGRHSRNPFKAPYRSGGDFRLKVRSYILFNIYTKNSIVSVIWWCVLL